MIKKMEKGSVVIRNGNHTDLTCSKVWISPTKNNYLADLFFAYTVNVYPQAISRDCSNKNYQSGAQKHWNTQIISQPRGVNPTF